MPFSIIFSSKITNKKEKNGFVSNEFMHRRIEGEAGGPDFSEIFEICIMLFIFLKI